ncbi:hypothetical protein KTQ42_21025 [Noviherbaspirillum sp. L7-7A]|uniref:hypothetical protein n=1 Tax=Noviherbaspirillum sp. L7-7A TaxID=2850560 RepID=UPI001C2C2E2C|nr:hypothetical protein [Noviherbaspirillum sp. L7-7A]MBV0881765.1 hypothetical protein [Noviherbaspirillum sp. L7-7A]
MMKLSRYVTILALAAFATQACAQVKAAPGNYVWYDGGKPRQLQLDSTVVAEFGDRAEAGGEPLMRGNGVRIWRQQDQAATRAAAGGAASPVFRDSQGSAMRALPGNVIVRLDPSWSGQQVDDWLRENRLSEVRRLPIGGNVLVLSSPPGLAALELANRLQQSGQVLSAQPEWWEQRSTR